jgi:hypothetical protein
VELGEDLITWVCLELNARALVSSWKVENLDDLNVGWLGVFITCRCFGSDRTPGVAPRGVFRSRTVSPTVAKWFVPDARGTMDSVYRFGPLRDA